jgi:chromosome partitioning protein
VSHRFSSFGWGAEIKWTALMPFVVSTINLKGGVGKTTISVALAETLASEFCKKVLLIDLDPQTSATIMLIGEERWMELNKSEHTLARLFKDALEPGHKQFDFEATLQKRVSNVSGLVTLDLLPASPDMFDVQEILAARQIEISSGFSAFDLFFAPWWRWPGFFQKLQPSKETMTQPIELLEEAIGGKIADYDIVIIDCPPNLGTIPMNGLYMSDAYIIPTVPDHLSTYGIPQLVDRVHRFTGRSQRRISLLGIVISKFQNSSKVHQSVRAQLETSSKLPVFKDMIRQSNQFAAIAEFVTAKRTLRKKYGGENGENALSLINLGREFLFRARKRDAAL